MRMRHAAVVAGLAMGLMSGTSKAASVSVSGKFPDSIFSAQIQLDVQNGQAVSGTGSFTGFGLTNADLVLITTSTPGNETSPGPVGFRANDGTDYGQFDQAYPVDTDGLLFNVGTTTAAFGQFPLFGFGSNGDGTYYAVFTGKVDGQTFYNEQDLSASVTQLSTVPLPASAPMFGAAILGLAGISYAAKRKKAAAAA